MREIHVSGCERPALVDDQDYERVVAIRWRAMRQRSQPNKLYAQGIVLVDGKGVNTLLHRFVMGLSPGDPRTVDHRDFDGLNCQRENLRLATMSQQRSYQRQVARVQPLPKGVWADPRNPGRYTARCAGKHLGSYRTPEAAAEAYLEAARRRYGPEFVLEPQP
jgi:hypothetical protein